MIARQRRRGAATSPRRSPGCRCRCRCRATARKRRRCASRSSASRQPRVEGMLAGAEGGRRVDLERDRAPPAASSPMRAVDRKRGRCAVGGNARRFSASQSRSGIRSSVSAEDGAAATPMAARPRRSRSAASSIAAGHRPRPAIPTCRTARRLGGRERRRCRCVQQGRRDTPDAASARRPAPSMRQTRGDSGVTRARRRCPSPSCRRPCRRRSRACCPRPR